MIAVAARIALVPDDVVATLRALRALEPPTP